jgi:hypothetical protein
MKSRASRGSLARCTGFVIAGLMLAAISPSSLANGAPESEDNARSLAPWPPDLPLPAAKPMGGWIETARVVQPCHTTGWLVVSQHKTWAKKLRDEFGFNVISISIPDSHNATADPISPAYGYDKAGKFRYDDPVFAEAMESFRAAGMHTILYSSLMHCGHTRTWETGQLGKEHPDWSQIDAKGAAVMEYGRPWLCPSSPAFDYCLDWTIKAVRRWKYDAVMIDNNEFFITSNNLPSCYCKHCQAAFRRYVAKRFGPEKARTFLGVQDLQTMCIPTDAESELYRLWKQWRSRVWAEATERFRTALRDVKPDIVLMANAQPLWGNFTLASELQLRNEDASLTESRGMSLTAMSQKMLLCQALGRGRPVFTAPDTWHGDFAQCTKATYVNGVFHDPTLPQSPETIRIQCAIGSAYGAGPWVTFVGISDPTPSAQMVVRQMQLAKRWREASAGATRYANVVSIFSTRQRDFLDGGERSLLPPHLAQLQKAQSPTEPLRDSDLPTFDLAPYRAVIAEGAACLTDEEASVLADWVKKGGTLLATPDVGTCDEVGRRRPSSLLVDLLGVAPSGAHAVGSGRVAWFAAGSDVVKTLRQHVNPIIQIEPKNSEWEATAFRQRQPEQFWVHVIAHGAAAARASQLSLQLPEGVRIADGALWTESGKSAAKMSQQGDRVRASLPAGVPYVIVRLRAQR